MASASEIHQLGFVPCLPVLKQGSTTTGTRPVGNCTMGEMGKCVRVELHTQAQVPSAHTNGASRLRAKVPPLVGKAPLVRAEGGVHARQKELCMHAPPPSQAGKVGDRCVKRHTFLY